MKADSRDGQSRSGVERLPLIDPSLLTMLTNWAAETDTGDRAELDELPDDHPIWSDLSATAEQCLGSDCPRYHDCFITRMRQRAAASDIVIVNHHLLCADAAVRQSAYGEVIPDYQVAIFDEAHQLEDVATQYFGLSVSSFRLEELARDADRVVGTRPASEPLDDVRAPIERVRDRARSFFAGIALDVAPARRHPSVPHDTRVRVDASSLADHYEAGLLLLGALEHVEAVIQVRASGGASQAEERVAPEDLLAIARRAGEIKEQLRFMLRANDPDYVYYVELRGRGVFLRAAPIDVSAIVRELFLDRLQATILTSATLAVDGSFDYIRRRLGLERASAMQLPSEFDYSRQAIVYLPTRIPDPRSPAFAEAIGREIVRIVKCTEGRAFVLFTSYAVLRAVEAFAAPLLDYPVLVQGTAPRSTLLHRFRTTPHSVLLATSSFWQGVDVIGDALSCVIIDKLPFASPGDPITAARMEAIASHGGDPFSDYQVPLAILTLQQGLGRLIRHRRDRGVLAVLDPRIRTRAYGRRFLQALPPAPVTAELADLQAFLGDSDRIALNAASQRAGLV